MRTDADGFPVTEWLEPHRSPRESREAAIDGVIAEAGSAFVIAIETRRFDLADDVIARSLGALFDPQDPDDASG